MLFNKTFGCPDHSFEKLTDIKPSDITEMGAEAIALDLDRTATYFASYYVHQEAKEWVKMMQDAGIPVMLFAGNHDIWTFSYLQKELGIQVFREPEMMTIKGKRFFLVHGDGRGKGDNGYKFLKWLFEGRLTQFLFRWIHPDIGLWIGLRWSMKHRVVKLERERKGDYYAVVDKTRLYRYAEAEAEKHPDVDFFVFGHQHKGMQYKTGQHAMTTIVGNWMWNRDYAVFDGNTVERKTFQEDPPTELT